MKIAFTSCMCTRAFRSQPVWSQIQNAKPDYLILLGDSIYYDIKVNMLPGTPREMDDATFAAHSHRLYSELLQQPEFRALVKAIGRERVYAVWDDHDFLWDGATGAFDGASHEHKGKMSLSGRFHREFRRTLRSGFDSTHNFPASSEDSVFWHGSQPSPQIETVSLGDSLSLHLMDLRSFRTLPSGMINKSSKLLGLKQQKYFETQINDKPEKIHILASSSTLAEWKKGYSDDFYWLMNLAKKNRVIVLSGDIHRNDTDLFKTSDSGNYLFEFTSSGAAVKTFVTMGKAQQNYGLLEISNKKIASKFFHFSEEQSALSRVIDISTWKLV